MNHSVLPCHVLSCSRRQLAGLWLMLLTVGIKVNAQTNLIASPSELRHYSLEKLMTIEVTTVSRQAEPWFGTPSGIKVTTSEDIGRSGAPSLTHAPRLAPNRENAQADS